MSELLRLAREQVEHVKGNAAALRKFGANMEPEARARELAAVYLLEIVQCIEAAALASQAAEPVAKAVGGGIASDLISVRVLARSQIEPGALLYAAPPAGISPAPLAGEWRPIETAPRSVQPILVLKEGRRMAIETGHYAHNMMHAAKVDGEECYFTHWMPLPAAPRAALSQGEVSGEGEGS